MNDNLFELMYGQDEPEHKTGRNIPVKENGKRFELGPGCYVLTADIRDTQEYWDVVRIFLGAGAKFVTIAGGTPWWRDFDLVGWSQSGHLVTAKWSEEFRGTPSISTAQLRESSRGRTTKD